MFTAGNIQRAQNSELDGDAEFKNLDFNAIYHDDYVTGENRDHILDCRMAEVMVPGRVDLLGKLKYLVFRTSYDLETFRFLLAQRSSICAHRTAVEQVNSSIFMHWGLYISEMSFVEDKLTLKFHFPRTTPPENRYNVFVRQYLGAGHRRTLKKELQLTSPTLTIKDYASQPDSTWKIRLEDVLAFRGELMHARSRVFG